MESTPTVDQPENTERKPLLTWLMCAICTLIFIGLSIDNDFNSWDTLSKYGYLPPDEIWNGKYWALITSVFVHVYLLHFVFNLYWLWVLGGLLEKTIGSLRWLVFFLLAAIVSSGIQFAISDSTGIGASGVVYAALGLIWTSRNKYPAFEKALSKQVVALFIGWLFLCVIATYTGVMSVGNAAHISGLAFGCGIGAIFVLRYRVRLVTAGIVVLIVASVIPLFWCPWSASWLGRQAYNAHAKGDYSKAVVYYEKSINRGGDPGWALSNIALAYLAMGDQDKYKATMERLRRIDEKAARELEEGNEKRPSRF